MAEIWNLSALCRCCLKDGQFTDLRMLLQDSDTNYTTLLQETFNISMDMPLLGASYAICDKCIEDLIGAHNFKVQVVECEQKFHEYCQNELATQCDLKEEIESVQEDVSDDNDNGDFEDFEPKDTGGSIEIEIQDVKPDFADDRKDKAGNEVIKTKKENPKRAVGRPKKIKRGRKKRTPDVSSLPPLHTLHPELQKYVKDEEDKRICTLCNYVYNNNNNYVNSIYGKHLREEHSINIVYKCDDCRKIFKNSTNLLMHNLYKHPKDKKPKPKLDKQLKVEKLKPIADKHPKDQKPKPITDKHPKDQEPKLKAKLVKPRMQLTRFQCKHCPRTYYNLSQYVKHSKAHEKVYCAGCKKTFNNNDLYEKHVCMKSELYDCRYCHKKMRKEYLIRHLKLHEKEFKCRLCNIKFDNSDLYDKHECKGTEDTGKNAQKYECDHCQKPFKKKSHLQRHIECCHSENKILCGSCKQTVNVSDLYEHVCEGSEPIKVIDKQFFNKSKTNKIVNKTKKVTEDKEAKKELFRCRNCKFKTFTYNKLVNHNIAQHRTDKNYYCDICNKGFVYKRSVEYHLALIHYKTYVKKFVCEFCGLRFKDRGIYNMHRRTVHDNIRAFICELCPLTFKDKKRLKLHILRHTGERPHKCDECEKAFFEWSTLKRHKQTHKNERENTANRMQSQFVCKMCKEIFPRNGDLLKHYNTIHRSNLPHKCDYCPKRFANRYSKNRHMNIHLGIRFTCPICKEVYVQKNNLQRHMKSVHELGTQKSYVKLQKCLECNRNYADYEKHKKFHENPLVRCEVCKKPYTNQSVLNRHMATLHGSTKVFECDQCPKKFLRLRGYQRHLKKKHHGTELFKKGIDSLEECSTEMENKNYLEIEIDKFKSDAVGTESKCTVRETTGTIL